MDVAQLATHNELVGEDSGSNPAEHIFSKGQKTLSVTPNWEFSLITNSNYGGLKKIKIITISDINISKDCLKDFTLSLLVSLVKIALKGKIY